MANETVNDRYRVSGPDEDGQLELYVLAARDLETLPWAEVITAGLPAAALEAVLVAAAELSGDADVDRASPVLFVVDGETGELLGWGEVADDDEDLVEAGA